MLHPNATTIPPLIPIVIQHDPAGWTSPRDFGDLYSIGSDSVKALHPYLINFRYHLDDLQTETEESLAARCSSNALRAVLMALKTGGVVSKNDAHRWAKMTRDLLRDTNVDLIRILVWYLLQRGSDAVVNRIREEDYAMHDIVDNVLDRKFNEGRAQEALRLIHTLLRTRADFQLTPAIQQRLDAARIEDLELWMERIFRGESPQSVLMA